MRMIGMIALSIGLWAFPATAANIKVAVVFEEQVRGVFDLSGSWMDPGRGEEVVMNALRNAGYRVVDSQTLRANLLREQAIKVLSGDQKAAVAAGTALQAPYLLTGNGFAKSAGQVAGSAMKSLQGQVQLTLIDAETGEILAGTTGQAAKPHVDETIGGGEAIAAAAEDAVQKMIPAIAKAEYTENLGLGPVEVTISGLKSYRHFAFIKEWFEKNVQGLDRIDNVSYTTGTARFDIYGQSSGHDLAGRIASASFQGFVVNPVDVSDDLVSLKVILRQ